MVLDGCRTAQPGAGLPRACGDGPAPAANGRTRSVSASRMRGWSRTRPPGGGGHGVGPRARGGGPGVPAARPRGLQQPRARGDGPRDARMVVAAFGSAPRMRGWSVPRRADHPPVPVCPPACGDGPYVESADQVRRVSALRTRDAPKSCNDSEVHAESAPRTRGWSKTATLPPGDDESALRTRGWSDVDCGLSDPHRGCSAHAGMVREHATRRVRPARLPGARGAGPGAEQFWDAACSSAPRTPGMVR